VLAVALASSSCRAAPVRLGALAAVAAEPDLLSSRDNLPSRCRRPSSGAGAWPAARAIGEALRRFAARPLPRVRYVQDATVMPASWRRCRPGSCHGGNRSAWHPSRRWSASP